jgi:hypothetical protein
VLRTLQRQRKNALLQLRIYFVGINLKRKPEGPHKATPTPLSAVVSRSLLAQLILALSTKGYRVAVNGDLKIVISHAGQFRRDDDPVLVSINVDGGKGGARCRCALGEPINLLLEEAKLFNMRRKPIRSDDGSLGHARPGARKRTAGFPRFGKAIRWCSSHQDEPFTACSPQK